MPLLPHKHYVPILKTKAGERWAIGNLFAATQKRITPTFEIHQHKKKGYEDHVAELCDDLVAVWGTDRRFFLDTVWLHAASGNASIITAVFDLARTRGLQAVPVLRLTYTTNVRTAIQKIVSKDKRGYLLRLAQDEFSDSTAIQNVVNSVGPRKNADLMLDYQTDEMELQNDIPLILNVNDWKTFIAASGAFPKSFTRYAQGQWHQIPRTDFTSWEDGLVNHNLPRKPMFADFTVRDPGPPADFGAPSVNLRYARNDYWLFRIGGKVNAGLSSQMHQVCADLIQHADYSGRTFSAGDSAIWDTANGVLGPGNPTQWVQWCVNHHIEFTVQQLAAHPSI